MAYYRRKGNDPTKRKYIIDDYNLIKLKNDTSKTVTVAYHPIFLDNIISFHTWKPIYLYQIVADYLNNKESKESSYTVS